MATSPRERLGDEGIPVMRSIWARPAVYGEFVGTYITVVADDEAILWMSGREKGDTHVEFYVVVGCRLISLASGSV
jgi:hypothetical protein